MKRSSRRDALASWALLVAATLLLTATASGTAQSGAWTVQVMALRDFREAESVVTGLKSLGFDAYSEFAMSNGEQFVRIRVGCFAGRDAADNLATAMSTAVTGEAVAVPIVPGAAIAACIEVDIGFLKDVDWRQRGAGSGQFEVVIGGETALVAHTGERWTVLQDAATAPTVLPAAAGGRFQQVFPNGLQMVQTRTATGVFNVCPGRLLAEVADAVIVERNDAVVACRLLTTTGGTP